MPAVRLAVLALLCATSAQANTLLLGVSRTTTATGQGALATSVPFTPLHTYFISTTGSDGADGLTPATAWATPNHPVACGDVILVAAGTYSTAQFGSNYQQPTGCPSTSGGIDGLGGIYFATLLCAGADIEACKVNTAGFGDPAVLVNFGLCCILNVARPPVSNWAIQGFHLDAGNTTPQTGSQCCRAIEMGRACNELGTGVLINHHIAIINTMITNVRQGMTFGPNNCGGPTGGSDYVAAVGLITQNATQENFGGFVCIASIDLIGTANWDNLPGTHFYAYNNYGMNHHNTNCENLYDVEFMMIDTPNNMNTVGLHVIANNMAFNAARACIQLTGSFTYVLPTYIYNNTCYGNNNLQTGAPAGGDGEINTSGGNITSGWAISNYNNVLYANPATGPAGNILFSVSIGSNDYPLYKEGNQLGVGKENIQFGSANFDPSGCLRAWPQGACAPSNTTPPFIGAYPTVSGNPVPASTANFYVNPTFTNTADLPNHYATPNCTGFETTTQCMGWNAATATLTANSVISDLTPTCAQCAGKGFQRAAVACNTNPDYPVWLKGINYLHASGFTAGATITQKIGLATRPCGL